ncbi:MAG: Gfo/Idh/MocA family oxidoreductase [FCB group bacterium]|jgi:predicted dehydrogenase|nr:Gfo/Idh/MocA family oxidoreductase [FCB group bacterium]
MNEDRLGLGVIGFGGFGLYAVQHYMQLPGIELVGMAGTHREAAYAAAQRFGIPDPMPVEELLARDDVDLVYIATPPFLHHSQAMAALQAGKHVLCEKPLAMNMEQADEMLALAREKNLLMSVNLMQRYNPLYEMVKRLIDSKAMGEVLHGFFDNYATDEGLGPDHWFWDPEKGGGIFIEHGVHFFDVFEGWLGKGEMMSAQAVKRPGTNLEDQVNCTVRYGEDKLVNFYHGFTQVSRMDRQEWRILFEQGDVTLYEWVPTLIRVRAVGSESSTRAIMDIFKGSRLDITTVYGGKDRHARGRHKDVDIYQMFDVTYGEGHPKMHRYGELVRDLFKDQVAWIRDRSHVRHLSEENGRASLEMAVKATQLAHGGE